MVESVLVVEGRSCAISPGLMTGNFKPLLFSFVSLLKSVALKVNSSLPSLEILFPKSTDRRRNVHMYMYNNNIAILL